MGSISIGTILANVIQLYSFLLILWCLLSWFPNIKWYDQPFKTLDRLVQPLCAPFRKVLPPINGIDFAPMIVMLVLQFASTAVRNYVP